MRTPGLQEGNDGYISIMSSDYKGTIYTSFRVPSLILLYLSCYKTTIAANKTHDPMDGAGFCIIWRFLFPERQRRSKGPLPVGMLTGGDPGKNPQDRERGGD